MKSTSNSFGFAALCFSLLSILFAAPASQAQRQASDAPRVIYEIYARSFQDSDGDGIGDLDGVTARLDYVRDLGADAIWLMPIFKSPSAHGYDVSDYDAIESTYGDLDAFKRFVREAHARGLKVILDLPVNSTAKSHPWFQASSQEILTGLGGPARDLYIWNSQPQSWYGIQWHEMHGQYYLSSFSSEMPDINWRNEEIYRRVRDVFLKWAALGVDGYRLDAAKHLVKGPHGETNQPETHAIWQRLVKDVKALHTQAFFVGEVWDSPETIASYYGKGDELSAAFDFPTMYGLRNSLKDGQANSLFYSLQTRKRVMPGESYASAFMGNHDTSRIASDLGGDVDKLKLAALVTLTLPGTATLYYGDELGVRNGERIEHQGDLAKRTPMPWTEQAAPHAWLPFSVSAGSVPAQTADPQSLLNAYKAILAVRNGSDALTYGTLDLIDRPVDGVLTYTRKAASGETMMVAINFGARESAPFKISSGHAQVEYGAAVVTSSSSGQISGQISGQSEVGPLKPKSGLIIRL